MSDLIRTSRKLRDVSPLDWDARQGRKVVKTVLPLVALMLIATPMQDEAIAVSQTCGP